MNNREILAEASTIAGNAIRDLAPRFGIGPVPMRRERARKLLGEHEANRVATDAAIEGWLVYDRFSHSLSEEVMQSAFFRLAGIEFLYRAGVPAPALQSLPPQQQTAKGLLRHLLIEWWQSNSTWPQRWLRDLDLGQRSDVKASGV